MFWLSCSIPTFPRFRLASLPPPLLAAASPQAGDYDTLEDILLSKFSADSHDVDGRTALMLAANTGKEVCA